MKPIMLKVDAEDAEGNPKSSGARKPAGRGAGEENINASGGSGGAGHGATEGSGTALDYCQGRASGQERGARRRRR